MPADHFTLDAYRRMLEAGLAAGYRFVGYGDIGMEAGPLSCLLRHDVDMELLGTGPMMELEQSLGVRATYFLMTRSTAYNLFCIESRKAVQRLLDCGHGIGLHFMGELCEHDAPDVLVDKVRREAAWLEQEFGTTLQAVSFHQPSAAILEGNVNVPGLVNTYNKAQMGAYFYVSDTNMIWRQEHPQEIFERRLHPRLQLLTHPVWWTAQPLDTLGKWRAALDAQRKAVVEHWLARERTLRDATPRDFDA